MKELTPQEADRLVGAARKGTLRQTPFCIVRVRRRRRARHFRCASRREFLRIRRTFASPRDPVEILWQQARPPKMKKRGAPFFNPTADFQW